MDNSIFGVILLGLLSLLVFRNILESFFVYRAKKKEREFAHHRRLELETSEAMDNLVAPGKTTQSENQARIIEEQKAIIKKLELELKSKATLPKLAPSQAHVEAAIRAREESYLAQHQPETIKEKLTTPDTIMNTPEKTKPKRVRNRSNRKTNPAKPETKIQSVDKPKRIRNRKPKTKPTEVKTERALIIPLEPRDPHKKIVLPIGTILTREYQRNVYTLTSVPGQLLKLAKNGTYVAVYSSLTKAAEAIIHQKVNGPVWW